MEQEQYLELLMDKVKHPRKYDHVCIPSLPGLCDCIIKLRELGVTKRLNPALKEMYDRIEKQDNSTTLERAFIYKPKTIL